MPRAHLTIRPPNVLSLAPRLPAVFLTPGGLPESHPWGARPFCIECEIKVGNRVRFHTRWPGTFVEPSGASDGEGKSERRRLSSRRFGTHLWRAVGPVHRFAL